MTRVKIGTSLDRNLLEQAQLQARSQGKKLNEVLEEALRLYLDRSPERPDPVQRTFGLFAVTDEALRAILEDDPYDA